MNVAAKGVGDSSVGTPSDLPVAASLVFKGFVGVPDFAVAVDRPFKGVFPLSMMGMPRDWIAPLEGMCPRPVPGGGGGGVLLNPSHQYIYH